MQAQTHDAELHHRLGRMPLFGRLFSPDPHLAELNAHLEPGEKIQQAVWGRPARWWRQNYMWQWEFPVRFSILRA